MNRKSRRERSRSALALTAVALFAGTLLAGCRLANPEPSATPADFPGITRVLGTAGIDVERIVAGDAGCADTLLSRNAISFTAAGLDQATPVSIHLYRFKDPATAEASLGAIGTCAQAYITDAATYRNIVAGPYVIVGDGTWGPTFTKTLTDGLERAAATGG